MSPNARDRARAKRRYVKRQAKLAQRQQARRTQQQVIGAAIAVVLVVFGVFALTRLNSSPSKKTTTPASAPSSTPGIRRDRLGLSQGHDQAGEQAAAVQDPAAQEPGRGPHLDRDRRDDLRHDDVHPRRQEGAADRGVVHLPGPQGLLRQHPVPPAHDDRALRPAVRRPDRHRQRRAGLRASASRTRRPPATTPRARSRWPASRRRRPTAASSSSSTRTASCRPTAAATRSSDGLQRPQRREERRDRRRPATTTAPRTPRSTSPR